MTDYQMSLSREIESRLKAKCDKLADVFVMDDIGRSYVFFLLMHRRTPFFLFRPIYVYMCVYKICTPLDLASLNDMGARCSLCLIILHLTKMIYLFLIDHGLSILENRSHIYLICLTKN